MQVTLETMDGLERKMRVSVPSEELESEVEAKLKETAQQVRLKGFRPGKVPIREVKRRFGEGIRQEVSSELIQRSFAEAVQQESVSPAGMPQIEEVTLEAGQDLAYTAVFEVFPEVTPGEFSAITVERPKAEIGEDDINEMIDKLQEQRTEFVEVDRPAANDDQINLDFVGTIDGEAFEGGSAEGTDLILGSGSMIPGFEDGLVGVGAGEQRDLSLSFPEDYHVEDLKGKDVVFAVTANSVSEPTRPALDDEFFKQFGVEEGGEPAFREEVQNNMTRELEAAVTNKTKTQVMDGLLDQTTVEIPQALINGEIDRMRQEAVQQFGGGAQIDPSVLPAEMFESQASRRVSLGLIINAVVEQNDITVDPEKVRETIEKLASSYEQPEQIVNYYYSDEQQLNQIRNMVLEEQVVDLILDQADVTDVDMTYTEAVTPTPPPVPELPEDADAEDEAKNSE